MGTIIDPLQLLERSVQRLGIHSSRALCRIDIRQGEMAHPRAPLLRLVSAVDIDN